MLFKQKHHLPQIFDTFEDDIKLFIKSKDDYCETEHLFLCYLITANTITSNVLYLTVHQFNFAFWFDKESQTIAGDVMSFFGVIGYTVSQATDAFVWNTLGVLSLVCMQVMS